MKIVLLFTALVSACIGSAARGEEYVPTGQVGEFLRQFEKAYRAGDHEWIRSAIDKAGVIDEAKGPFFGFLGPKEGGEAISDLKAVAAPENYEIQNSLLDFEIEPTIAVDLILTFKRTVAKLETTIKVPVGYREGKIWMAGVKRK